MGKKEKLRMEAREESCLPKDEHANNSLEKIDEEKRIEGNANNRENDVEEKKILLFGKCIICLHEPAKIVYLPCTHMVACASCTLIQENCPHCSTKIEFAFPPIVTT